MSRCEVVGVFAMTRLTLLLFVWQLVSSYLDVASATEDDADLIQPAYRDRAHERREVALARLTA